VSGGRSAVRKLALAAFAVAFGLGLTELVLRRLPASVLGFEYEDGTFRGPREFGEDTATNRFGFHDVEHGAKRAGSFRVLLLGDSYVAALSMRTAETVGRRLEEQLRKLTGRDVEVVSIGRPGWGQVDELRALERFGRRVRPDLVLDLALTFNDLVDNSPALDRQSDQQLARIARVRPGWTRIPAERAPLFWLRSSVLNRLISHRLALLLARRDGEIPLDYLVYATPASPEWLDARRRTEALILALRDESARWGARFAAAAASTPHGARGEKGLAELFAAYPAMRGRSWDLGQPDRWLGESCRRAGIAFLALEPTFRRLTAAGQVLHWRFDGHWNRDGNAVAGHELARFVAPFVGPAPLPELPIRPARFATSP
jgi:hypothetical protein